MIYSVVTFCSQQVNQLNIHPLVFRFYSHIGYMSTAAATVHKRGKEQRLHFAKAGVKRYPMSKIKETQVKTVGVSRGHQRADRLKP